MALSMCSMILILEGEGRGSTSGIKRSTITAKVSELLLDNVLMRIFLV